MIRQLRLSHDIIFLLGCLSVPLCLINGFSPSTHHVNIPKHATFKPLGFINSSVGKAQNSSRSREKFITWSTSNMFQADSTDHTNLKLSPRTIPKNVLSWAIKHKTQLATAVALTMLSLPTVTNAAPIIAEIADESTVLANSAATMLQSFAETGFYQSFSLVFLSEIGDKTFFIAGLLAMKTSRLVSFLGAMAALGGMTVISCLIGQIFHAIPSGLAGGLPLDDIAAVLAFAFFGFKILKETSELDSGESVMDEELADAEEAVQGSKTTEVNNAWAQIISACGLVFAAEFGDRSFLTTIALSAAQNPFSVGGGAIVAHGVATGIAVLGGGAIAEYISEKVIGYISGALFIVFAITTAFGIF